MATVIAMPGVEREQKARRERGQGRIWQVGRIWYIQYYSRGQQMRESSHSDVKMVAQKLLEQRLKESKEGQTPAVQLEKVKYEHLREALFADYRNNHRKSLRRLKDGTKLICGVPELDEFFSGRKAVHIGTDLIRKFISKRQDAEVPNGTINRSLAVLRRMFTLAVQDGKLRDLPYIPMLKEPPARRGFLEHEDFLRLRQALPEYLRPVTTLGFYTGMRRGEIVRLRWSNVSLADKEIRLDAGTTKNDEPRSIPLIGELPEMLAILRDKDPKAEFVFTRAGNPLGLFRKAWASACVKAGLGRVGWYCEKCVEWAEGSERKRKLCTKCGNKMSYRYVGLIFHDLRRTGVRNLVRAGVPERVAMAISGHKTRAVFERYNIVSGRDLRDAGRKLEAYLNGANAENGGNSGQMAENSTSAAAAASNAIN